MKYLLNDSVMLHESLEEGTMISVTGSDIINISDKEDIVLEVFKNFIEPKTYEEAYKIACKETYISEDDFQECFEFMRLNNLLKECDDNDSITLSDYHLEKYKRQISSLNSLPGIERTDAKSMQQKICESCVCVIGVGGTGSHLALAIASIGVEKMILVDFDSIELSNTARQILYDESDVGKHKLDVAKEKLQRYNSKLDVDTYNVYIKSPDDLIFLQEYKVDLLVLCADTPRGEIQYIIDAVATNNSIPWFCYGPYNHSQITVGPLFVPGQGKTYSEIFQHSITCTSSKIDNVNQRFIASICDPYNGFASQFAVIESFKFLSGYRKPSIINRRYYIDTDTWEMEHADYD